MSPHGGGAIRPPAPAKPHPLRGRKPAPPPPRRGPAHWPGRKSSRISGLFLWLAGHRPGAVPQEFLELVEGLSPAQGRPRAHQAFHVAALHRLGHARLHLVHHLFLQGRHVRQAHQPARLLRGHLQLDVYFHGLNPCFWPLFRGLTVSAKKRGLLTPGDFPSSPLPMEPAMNALDTATSPYLLAHKDNPVAWRVWSNDVLAEAEKEGKPILLSLGYSACHWCHVMNRESFSDPETAKLINENFIPVIADRFQQPDLDQLYQATANAMGHQGGWPLNLFLNAKGYPYFVAGYLPKEDRVNQPAFNRVLTDMAALYRDKPDDVAQSAQIAYERAANLLDRNMRGQPEAIQLDVASMRIGQRYDIFLGGQIGNMKFPQTIFLEILWRAYLRTGIQQFIQLVTTTMDASVLGGLYDHIGGGFFRYTADERWLVPHFEKMLADNALMIEFLTSVWQFNRNGLCRQRIEESVAWLLRDLKM